MKKCLNQVWSQQIQLKLLKLLKLTKIEAKVLTLQFVEDDHVYII